MRDVRKQAEQGKKLLSERRELTFGELQQFFKHYAERENPNDGLWEVIADAFYMGVATGIRQERARVTR
jgi:vacuolar-type H+-ATPase subunit D/Vma8